MEDKHLPTIKGEPPQNKRYKIGNTTYLVSMRFSKTSHEDMEDKIKRLIEYEQKRAETQ